MDEIFRQNSTKSSGLTAATKEIKLSDDEDETPSKPTPVVTAMPTINIKPPIMNVSEDNSLGSPVNHKPPSAEIKVNALVYLKANIYRS